MNDERHKILDMLKDGTITVEEAERLLNALGGRREAEPPRGTGTAVGAGTGGGERTPRYLRVTVEGSNGDHVNVRVPLQLIRAGMRFSSLVPEETRRQVEEKLAEKGIRIDLAKPKPEDIDELVRALGELEVNVDGNTGDRVRVFCE